MDDHRFHERTRFLALRRPSRRTALRLLVASAAGLALPGRPAPRASAEFEAGWRLCRKCRGLYAANFGPSCPAGVHELGDREYALRHGGTPAPGQETNWRWCYDCGLLHFNGGGACAGSSTGHDPRGGVYHLDYNQRPSARQEGGWRYCPKDKVLFRPKRGDRGVCAAGGSHEVYPGYRYNLRVVGR